MSRTILNNDDDVIDSRDVIERIAELEEERDSFILEHSSIPEEDAPGWRDIADAEGDAQEEWDETAEGEELKALQAFADDAEDYSNGDWAHGSILIRDSYFETYAQELAEEIGAIDKDWRWPATCIDWEQAARELQMDYSGVEFSGVTYWIR